MSDHPKMLEHRNRRALALCQVIRKALPSELTSQTVGARLRSISREDWVRAGLVAGFKRPPSQETIGLTIIEIEAQYAEDEERDTSTDLDIPERSLGFTTNDIAPVSGVVWH